MKIYILIYCLLCMSIIKDVHAQSYANLTDHKVADTLVTRATKLKQFYLLSKSSLVDVSDNYKKQFFDCFPNTFKELDELYGDHYDADHKSALLNDQAERHIADLFNNLNNINDTLYYRKIVSIAICGHWDADAINFFQHGLRNKVLSNPALIVLVLKGLSNDKIQSFWYFYFDGPIVKKQIVEPLQKVKTIDSKIYDLMIKGHDDALKQNR
jgi:hypothetical protein